MGASGTDNFCLRWNDFAENVSGAFKDLRAENDFFDVTLACSDSGARTLQAHKVILSACSNFFKTTFRQQSIKHPNPYIYLRGVSYTDLLSILDFIYNGEVNVAQEDLNSFLAVAEELQIKGLTNRDSSSNDNHTTTSTTTSSSSSAVAASNASSSARKSGAGGRPPKPVIVDHPPPVKKARRSSPAPTPASVVAAAAAAPNVVDIAKDVVNIKDDPEAIASTSSAVNPDEASSADFGGDDYDESYDGYYEDDGADIGEGGEEGGTDGGTDGTKGLLRIRNHLSSAEDEFTNIMLERHAAGRLRRAFTLDEYTAIISRLEAVRAGLEKPNFNDIKMLKMYSIATYPNGEKFLVKLSKSEAASGGAGLSDEDLLSAERFIPIEKLFPFIITAHLETKHGKRDTLMKRLREMKVANAGRDTVLLFLSLCESCANDQ